MILPENIPVNCFISHSYQDKYVVDLFLKKLPPHIRPFIFPAITVTPNKMVSTPLIKSLLASEGLIYIKGGMSDRSFWVAFERSYAQLAGKKIFSYDPRTGNLLHETNEIIKPPVFPSYRHNADSYMPGILHFLRNERYFDLFIDADDIKPGELFETKIMDGLQSRLESGGYVVLFYSRASGKSEWMRKEIESAYSFCKTYSRIIVATLHEEAFADFNFFASDLINKGRLISLCQKGKRITSRQGKDSFPKGLDQNKLDDLIVLIYWLIFQHSSQAEMH